jgi:hypothetical protein
MRSLRALGIARHIAEGLMVLGISILPGLVDSAQAATVTKSPKGLCVLRLEGEIVDGDLKRLEAMATSAFKGVDGESSEKDTICLNSPGGSVSEGVRLSEFFYKNGVGTVIDDGDKCYSICAIMFMMGIAQGPEVNFVNRKLHVAGSLGFYRPYLAIDSDELVRARVLNSAHDAAIESIMKIMILANNHVPWSNSTMMRPDLIQQMLNHIGDDLFYIDTVEKAGRFEIELIGTAEQKGLTEEQAYYACENSFHWQVGLMDEKADFVALKKALGSNGSADVVKLVRDDGKTRFYSVTSGDAGYSEAGCLLAQKETHIEGCGYNGMYNVLLGQGQCTMADFEDRGVYVPRLATYKPDTRISTLAAQSNASPAAGPIVGAKISAICSVLPPSGIVDQQPCVGVINHNVEVAGKRADRYDFTWPTGNKTIIIRDGEAFSINGKSARVVADDKFSFCVINTESRNRFCFKM